MKAFIVSGGGIEFMRPWTEAVYGIPPEQVVGSSIKTRFEMRGGAPVLLRLPEINFIDDKEGKPVLVLACHTVFGFLHQLAIAGAIADQHLPNATRR